MELRLEFDVIKDLSTIERIYFKALVLESLEDIELNTSSYTIYFNSNYYSTYALLSCYKIVLDSVSINEVVPQWWYELNKSGQEISLYEMFTNEDSESPAVFIKKLVYYNKRIHYLLAHSPEGDYYSHIRLIEKRMYTLITSTENTLDALLSQ